MPNMTIEHSMMYDTVTHPECFLLMNLDQSQNMLLLHKCSGTATK